MLITVIPALEAFNDPLVIRMVVSASTDQKLCDATYLPYVMGTSEATRWMTARPGLAWVLVENGIPVGWWEITPLEESCGFTFPTGSWEREVWLVPEARGRRIVQRSTELLHPQLLAHGVTHLVGIAWRDNVSGIRGMQNAGFELLGEGWWGSASDGGLCVVGVQQLGPADSRSGVPRRTVDVPLREVWRVRPIEAAPTVAMPPQQACRRRGGARVCAVTAK